MPASSEVELAQAGAAEVFNHVVEQDMTGGQTVELTVVGGAIPVIGVPEPESKVDRDRTRTERELAEDDGSAWRHVFDHGGVSALHARVRERCDGVRTVQPLGAVHLDE